jgi:hypothetical protein
VYPMRVEVAKRREVRVAPGACARATDYGQRRQVVVKRKCRRFRARRVAVGETKLHHVGARPGHESVHKTC